MGRHENADGFRGYLVRIQTKEGRVYRHRKMRLALESKTLRQGLMVQTSRGSIGLTGEAGGRSLARAQIIEETTLDEFVALARVRTKLPGEADVRGVDIVVDSDRDDAGPGPSESDPRQPTALASASTDEEQVAKLYELGILYDDDKEQPTPGSPSAAGLPSTSEPAPDVPSPYQADSLDTIRHAEPLYTVRHVAAKPRRGSRGAGRGAATPAPPQNGEAKVEAEEEALRLFALDGLWEEEEGHGQAVNGRQLLGELEQFEYVVIADDDLQSLAGSVAGSWVELESAVDTDVQS